MVRRLMAVEPEVSRRLVADVARRARPLRSPADLDPLLACIGDARIVLLGEATHGTHEFYTWRAAITRRLVEERGFSFVAVEGDWPDCYRVNRFLKGHGDGEVRDALETFRRWPTWMWANEEVREMIAGLRRWNDGQAETRKVGFYGLDVYSLWDSLHEVMRYLRTHAPDALFEARRALKCFQPYGEDAQEYARATRLIPHDCEDEVVDLLHRIRTASDRFESDSADGHFVAEQNALVVKNAEAYYRAMVRSDAGSWNIRDRHMAETLDRLLVHHGPQAKAVVWEHNTHIGDARFTDMADDGMVNIGQLARERYGAKAVLVGFGTHHGRVIAGRAWGDPWEEMRVPAGRDDSWEDVFHRASPINQLHIFDRDLSDEWLQSRGHRAIGVVYRPQYEAYGNYVPTILARRYDAFLFFDETAAVRPLFPADVEEPEEVPETFPTGV